MGIDRDNILPTLVMLAFFTAFALLLARPI
jgi:hypothetical protein